MFISSSAPCVCCYCLHSNQQLWKQLDFRAYLLSPQELLNTSAHPYTGLHPQPCWCHMHITLGQVLDNWGMLMTAMRKGQGLSSDGVGAPVL